MPGPSNPIKRMLRRHRMRSLAPPVGPQPGDRYKGSVCYSTDPLIGPPGYYGTDEANQIIPDLRLIAVDNQADPDSPHHYIVADPAEPYYVQRITNPVHLQAHIEGKSEVKP